MFRVTPSRPAAVCHHMQVVYYVSRGEYWQERPLAGRQLDGQTAKQPAKQPASKPAKQSAQISNVCETEQRQSIQAYSDNYKENHSQRETENRERKSCHSEHTLQNWLQPEADKQAKLYTLIVYTAFSRQPHPSCIAQHRYTNSSQARASISHLCALNLSISCSFIQSFSVSLG